MLRRWRRKAIAWGQRLRVRVPLSLTALRGAYRFAQLIEIVRILRSPHGCPWDQKQRREDVLPYLREEAIEAIAAGHKAYQAYQNPQDELAYEAFEAFAEELGDLTFVSLFIARLYEEDGQFDIAESVGSIVEKMLRRHPHVFDAAPRDTDAINRNWQRIKAQERAHKEARRRHMAPGYQPDQAAFRSILDDAITSMSALQDALEVSKIVVKVGFEWPDIQGVWDKVLEEVEELREVLPDPTDDPSPAADRASSEAKQGHAAILQARQREELGDLLFTLVNLGRHLGIDCDEALRSTCAKFIRRFQYIERQLHASQQPIEDAGLDALEALWQEAKAAQHSAHAPQ